MSGGTIARSEMPQNMRGMVGYCAAGCRPLGDGDLWMVCEWHNGYYYGWHDHDRDRAQESGPVLREPTQADIDAVHGECDIQDGVWCLVHQSRVAAPAVRCDDWRDVEATVDIVLGRLRDSAGEGEQR